MTIHAKTDNCAAYQLRVLDVTDLSSVTDHVLALTPYDRYLRFCGAMSDAAIARLLQQRVSSSGHVFIGCFYQRGLVGVVQIAQPNGEDDYAEVAISVGSDHRRAGIAKMMVDHAIHYARTGRILGLSVSTLPENMAMISLAKKLGFQIRTTQNLVEGFLALKHVRRGSPTTPALV